MAASSQLDTLESFANFKLKKVESDEEVEFGSFWADGPCIVFFMRRFGCQICRWHAKSLNTLSEEFKHKRSGRVIAIGPESLGAAEFVATKLWNGEVYFDPEKKLYEELRMKRMGMLSLVGGFFKKGTWDCVNKSKHDGVSGNLKGDIYQLGGLFGVEKGGKLLFQFRQNDFSESADLDALAKNFDLEYKPPAADDSGAKPPVCASESCSPVAPVDQPAQEHQQQQ